MKKGLSLFAVAAFSMVFSSMVFAQEAAAAEEEAKGTLDVLKEYFVAGGPLWMSLPLICLILGLAFVIERIVYLNAVDVNTDKFMDKYEDALTSGGIDEAKEVAASTKGPVASLAFQAAQRVGDGSSLEDAEKSVISYGGVEVGRLERNVSWIALFIAIAPMLGFMGTVVGMILAFDDIEASGSVQAQDMAGNIKVALLTTLAGLIVAIILQIFYNYITAKIDSIVNNMENSSVSIVDVLLKYKK